MNPPNLPTIKDVAREAGVHYSTVSLALRGNASIPEATRLRVLKAASKVGYHPNPAMAALSRFRSRTQTRVQAPPRIAFLINRSPELRYDAMVHLHQFLEGARQYATTIGYELERLFVAEDHHDSTSLHRYLQAQGIGGLIIGSFIPGFSGVTLDWSRYAVVKIDSQHLQPDCESVMTDQLQITRLAFQHLTALGYQRIGLAVGRADEDSNRHRHTAGLLVEQARIPADRRIPPLLFPHGCDDPTASGLVCRWARRHRLDAVLCNWGNIIELLAEGGISCPGDLACACLCLLDTSGRVAGVAPELPLIGAKALALLATQMRTGVPGLPRFPSITYVQGHWKEGASAPAKR